MGRKEGSGGLCRHGDQHRAGRGHRSEGESTPGLLTSSKEVHAAKAEGPGGKGGMARDQTSGDTTGEGSPQGASERGHTGGPETSSSTVGGRSVGRGARTGKKMMMAGTTMGAVEVV